jgi:sugar lactone lactonase YvrE
MTPDFAVWIPACAGMTMFGGPLRFRKVQLSFILAGLAYLFAPMTARAQVTFTGPQPFVNLGSQAVGSSSIATSLPFTIAANTTVGSIGVLTTGSVGMDFVQATGSTCTAATYTTTTNCMVNADFKPAAPGLRLGAVVFYSGAHGTGTVLASVPVFGIGTGPELVFGPGGAKTRVGSKFISPEGVAVDAAGNVYVTDFGLQKVFKAAPRGAQTTVGTGLEMPAGVAVDGAGNVYITDSQVPAVFKVTPGGVQTQIGSGFSFPAGVAVDGAGNVYVSDPFVDAVFEITPAGTQTTVGGGYNTPAGVAVDAEGDVYVADTFNAEVFKITPGGTQSTVGTGLISPAAVAVDAAGDVYITDDGTDSVDQVTPEGVQTTIIQGLDVPNGIARDGSGNLYLANTFSKDVLKVDRADAPPLTFADTKIDHTSADSPKTVQVGNIGNAALNFLSLSFPADFPQDAADTCTSSTSLAPAGNCALSIDFSPVAPLGGKPWVLLKEAVTFTTNDLNLPQKVERVDVTGKEIR